MDHNVQSGTGRGGPWFEIGKGQDLTHRVTVGHRRGRAYNRSIQQHCLAAVAIELAVGLNREIGADPGFVFVESGV